ncbi:SRPBCC family protein [Sedimentitalea sp. CY04]|uniref:SRPBCC family protein n=1 Tax=Parasedimentitalea denitrificans TaxID=2211118 RepID=A0ABX0WEP9_9RHOB|nr:SRPBCC family protein [Sedimentitalea sp. CY04]NIZ63230.1 SRPBCC family protein [Sedimentitalea sp. CY04]
MAQITKEKTVNAPLSEVWKSWDAYADVHTFHPGVENSYLLEGSKATGNGAKRRCDFVGGKNHILEEIVAYEPEKKLTIKIYDGNVPLKVAYVTFAFQALGPSQTKITVSADFSMKMGLLGKLISPIMRKQLGAGLGILLDGNAEMMDRQAA